MIDLLHREGVSIIGHGLRPPPKKSPVDIRFWYNRRITTRKAGSRRDPVAPGAPWRRRGVNANGCPRRRGVDATGCPWRIAATP